MPNIRHELLIGASAEKIFQAITTQEGLAAWWTPDAKAKPELSSIARFPFGPAYFKEMNVAELVPFKLVKWICIKGADEWIGTSIFFRLQSGNQETLLRSNPEVHDQMQQLQEADKITLVSFQHDDWKEYTAMFAECNYTWGRFLRSLKSFCETGRGCPFPNQHRS